MEETSKSWFEAFSPRLLMGVGIFLFIVSFSFSGCQQLRIWRWSKLMKAAKIRIVELETTASSAKLEGMKEVAETLHTKNKVEVRQIDEKLKVLEEKKKAIESQVGRLTPKQLLEAFKEEGL